MTKTRGLSMEVFFVMVEKASFVVYYDCYTSAVFVNMHSKTRLCTEIMSVRDNLITQVPLYSIYGITQLTFR